MIRVMEIEDRTVDKEFLGGWKNVVTGREYEDAATQTSGTTLGHVDCEREKEKALVVITSASKYTTVYRDTATQTYFWPDSWDKLLTPSSASRSRRTEDSLRHRAEELFFSRKFSRLEEESARKIQKFFRACRTRTEISSLARFAVQTRTYPAVSEGLVRLPDGNKFAIVERYHAPRSRSDFEMLRNVLDHWRNLENERVDRTLFDSSRMAAKAMILLREIELLRSIERAKMQVQDEMREQRNIDYLEILAKPEIWRTRDGKTLEVETLRMARARECRDMYHALAQENDGVDRISMLHLLKKYIFGHTCQSSRDLEYLIEQELDFSRENFDPRMLDQLRKRVKLAFFQFALSCCEPRGKNKICGDKRKMCIRCGKLLSLSMFVDAKQQGTCNNCTLIRPTKDPAILYEPYEQMLKDLRRSEAQMGSPNGLAFKINPRVLHHLVNYIWHGKSGISEFDDLFQLRLLRFQSDHDWSPWNSILLTKREAAIHQAMTNPWELYDASLVKRFVLRNLQAKLSFDSLANIN